MAAFFGSSGGAFVLGFGSVLFVVELVIMAVVLDGERGGEGARPVDGVTRDDSGSERFSRGFLNIEMLSEHS